MKRGITVKGFKRLARFAQSLESSDFEADEPEVRESEEFEDVGTSILDVINFLHENPNPDDTEVHDWAEKQGLATDKVEQAIYSLASSMVQLLHDGKAMEAGLTEDEVDAQELERGIEVEAEHTSNPLLAQRIAMDHLSEIPDYYERLAKMESEAKGAES